jgi:hypothetical protein
MPAVGHALPPGEVCGVVLKLIVSAFEVSTAAPGVGAGVEVESPSGAPQFVQNLIPSLFSRPHFKHFSSYIFLST